MLNANIDRPVNPPLEPVSFLLVVGAEGMKVGGTDSARVGGRVDCKIGEREGRRDMVGASVDGRWEGRTEGATDGAGDTEGIDVGLNVNCISYTRPAGEST